MTPPSAPRSRRGVPGAGPAPAPAPAGDTSALPCAPTPARGRPRSACSPSTALVVPLALALALASCRSAPDAPATHEPPVVSYDRLKGQIEAGGPFAGLEFHDSRPLPARISFYYPVANSIDLSTDYWERGRSKPWSLSVTVDGQTEYLEDTPAPYAWAPDRVTFFHRTSGFDAELAWRFTEDLPLVVLDLRLTNRRPEPADFDVSSRLHSALRTSHAYTERSAAATRTLENGLVFLAEFDTPDTDSARVFVVNAGHPPLERSGHTGAGSEAIFDYTVTLDPGESVSIVQLVGSTTGEELDDTIRRARSDWSRQVAAYENRVTQYVTASHLSLPDEALRRTATLAKVLLQANRHVLDGRLMPMPCPAEYNFFFTHDLLQTNLGAIRFDPDRVRSDFELLLSLSDSAHVLPHAYYWREGRYVTEWAGSDNWNHLWLVILAGSYLNHSGDVATVRRLYPMLRKSLDLVLTNERDGLMYGMRPDWWDIGNVYGARAYLTILTIRALESFVSLSLRLDVPPDDLVASLDTALRLRAALRDRLWDDDLGYLINEVDDGEVDTHLYAGSLLAAPFDLLETTRRDRLLDTARNRLLDPHLGIRNVVPADFHDLTDRYRFNGPEVGGPYLYLNGGIWPQGSAWYVLGLLSARRPDEARDAVFRYLSIDGLLQSPNGQPAFYEYRRADAASPRYGEIDKPTFLWAGGWFLHLTYGLMGVRENAWNLSLDAGLPEGYDTLSFDLAVHGTLARVEVEGMGDTFSRIRVDGDDVASAVLTGPAHRIQLRRGPPGMPYLASATVHVAGASYEQRTRTLWIDVTGVPGQAFRLEIVSPYPAAEIQAEGLDGAQIAAPEVQEPDTHRFTADARLTAHGGRMGVIFHHP